MADHIETTWGSCLDIDFEFSEDITGDSFSIADCSPEVFREAVFTKTDPSNGKLHMFLAAEHARGLVAGCGNWFRLRRSVLGGCDDNTPEIKVLVQ